MTYRIGLINFWDHVNYITQPAALLPDAAVVAVAAVDPEVESKFKRNPVSRSAKYYSDYRDMLESEDLDIVGVYTTHGERAAAIQAAARAGAHVFAEKPLAMDLNELQSVKDAVESAGVTLTMMLNMRFDGVYRKMRDIVRSGEIGEVALATAQKSYKVGTRPEWVKTRERYAGTIPYIGCHALDLIRWTTGLEFVKGAAFHNNINRPELGAFENSANIILTAENGATLSARLDYCRPGTAPSWGDDRLRIAGTRGVVETIGGEITLMSELQRPYTVSPAPAISQFDNLIAFLKGEETLELPADDCYRITEVVLKLREAADRQAMIEL